MKTNNNISYQLEPPKKWFKQLQQFIPSVITDNAFVFKEEIGKGKLQFLQVQEGLWSQEMNFTLHNDLILYRVAKPENNYFLIDFYLSDAKIKRTDNNKTYTQSFQNINLVLTSSKTESKIVVPGNESVKIFNILFSKKWLFQNILTDNNEMVAFFNSEKPIYLSENLDYKLKNLVTQINFEANNRITSMANILQIIEYLFVRFSARELTAQKTKIHPDDLNQILKIKHALDQKPEESIPLQELAILSGMSLSKFKQLFKQVVGNTPYQYHLQNKMEKAMEVIKQGKYSVSETGFLMGYSNLSQFSKAFKKHFGLLPSEVLV